MNHPANYLAQINGLLLLVLVASSADANVFISLGYPSVEIGGDMDGVTFVGGGGSSEIMPEQEDGNGSKFSIGFYSDDVSMDINLVRTNHDGQWLGFDTESDYQSLNIDVKGALLGSEKLRGLAIIGLGFSSVKIEDGSVGATTVEDAKFKGLDFRLGIGARYRLMKNLALEANLIKRLGSYNSVDGVVSGNIDDSLDGDGTTTSIELIYIFAD